MSNEDLQALKDRIQRIYNCCGTFTPKQAVGEMLEALLSMPEWNSLEEELAPRLEPTSEEVNAMWHSQEVRCGAYLMPFVFKVRAFKGEKYGTTESTAQE